MSQQLPKRIKFVLDISGSMYTYNRLDGRLTRVLQALIMLMEALDGFEHKYEYSVVGHSGAASAVLLVPWASPPKTRLERLKLVRKMVTHAQTCKSGDHTLQATKHRCFVSQASIVWGGFLKVVPLTERWTQQQSSAAAATSSAASALIVLPS